MLFFERFYTHSKGELGGKSFALEPWQQDYVRALFAEKDGKRVVRTSLLALPRKNGKALAVDTPIATPSGWTTMGELKPGDYVFQPSGKPIKVIAASPVMLGRPCYEVRFSQATHPIVADAEHLWRTKSVYETRSKVRTTKEIAETATCGGRSDRRHSVEACGPLETQEQLLPIDPYVLGAWLGDGTSVCAAITCSSTDEPFMRPQLVACGVPVSPVRKENNVCLRLNAGRRSSRKASLQRKLSQCGLLRNKHIPRLYLRSSISQRWQLLRGLMDTDGYVSKTGQCEFCSTSKRLANGVYDLVLSLGMKAGIREADATLNGRFISKKYRVMFTPLGGQVPFCMPRKIARLRQDVPRTCRSKTRQIKSCEPVESVPVRCIQVDSPDGMFVAGRDLIPTHNSSLCAGIALRLLLEDEPGVEVYSCAASRDQARLVFDMARVAVEQSPVLSKHLKVYRNAIVREETHGTYKALSAEAGIQHGLSAHGVIFDELHVSNREMWEVMLSSQGARRQPLTVALTTAGYDRKSVCWEVWKYAEQVATGAIKDDTFLPAIYAAPIDADWKDEKTWAVANPNLGVSVKLDFLRSECARAIEMPTYENTFRQLYLNQWTEQDTRWLRMDHWAQGSVECPTILDGRECWAGLDLATTYDTTAFVMVFPLEDGKLWVEPHFWIPSENMHQRVRRDKVAYDMWAKQGFLHVTEGNVTDFDQVRADINELAKKYNIRQVAIDRWNATQLANQLQGDGLSVVGFGQGYGSMSSPSKQLEAACVSGKLLHGGHPVLAWQAGNVAIQQDTAAGNIKPSKAKSTERIDGIVALVMAMGIYAAQDVAANSGPEIFFV